MLQPQKNMDVHTCFCVFKFLTRRCLYKQNVGGGRESLLSTGGPSPAEVIHARDMSHCQDTLLEGTGSRALAKTHSHAEDLWQPENSRKARDSKGPRAHRAWLQELAYLCHRIIYIYICINLYMNIYIYTHICTYMSVCLSLSLYIYVYIYIYTLMY